jgi:hypothetical protein
MPRITRRHLVIGGGILITALLIWTIASPRGGDEDPPPIIVSSGGSIYVELQPPAQGMDAGQLDWALWTTWYHALDDKQHLPDWLDVTVYGASVGQDPCGTYTPVKRLVIDYGAADPRHTIDASIGMVWAFTKGKHLKFVPDHAKGERYGNSLKRVDFDPGETVYLNSVTIHQDSGPPVTCTFQPQNKDSKITIQERHTP